MFNGDRDHVELPFDLGKKIGTKCLEPVDTEFNNIFRSGLNKSYSKRLKDWVDSLLEISLNFGLLFIDSLHLK